MICPHCKKAIQPTKKVDSKTRDKVLELSKQGYSSRDIQGLLEGKISFVTVSRIIKKEKK